MRNSKQKWQLIVTRRLNVLRVFVMAEGSQGALRDYLGVGADALVVTKDERGKYYLATKDLKSIGSAILSKIQENFEFSKMHADDCKKACEFLVDTAKKVSADIQDDVSHAELKARLEKYVEAHKKFVPFMVIPVAIEQVLTKNISQYIVQKKSAQELEEYLNRLTTLPQLPEVMKEQRALVSLAIDLKEVGEEQYRELLKKHVEKYEWLGCYNSDEPPFTYEQFDARLKELMDKSETELKKELENAEEQFKNDQTKYEETAKKLDILGNLLEQLNILRNYVYLRTYRVEMQSQSYYWIKGLLENIGARLDLSLRTLGGMLPQEIYLALGEGKLPDVDKIEERVKNNVLHSENGVIELYSGTKGESVINNELGIMYDATSIEEIKGTIAYKGKVRGNARILQDKNQIDLFLEGEILVTSMTTPEFVPAMKKAIAIITDEGGVLCHAAIVAREMQKPCIIGTKIATQVLNDGDLIEVDATKGVISIIKKV